MVLVRARISLRSAALGRGFVLSVACLVVFALGAPLRAADVDTLEIVSKSGVHVFAIELAVSEDARARGLMFRRELPEGRGMLFKFEPDQVITMWMQNTYVSLDMIFIRGDGRILRIAENTEPLSTRTISSGGAARGVLEVVAGTARKLGIAPGDRVAHPWFGRR